MSTVNSTVATIDSPATVADVDDLVQEDLGIKSKRDGAKPPKLTKAEKALVAKDAAEAARLKLQERVPWELLPQNNDGYGMGNYSQLRVIDQWADDWGAYPRVYRSYSREEWTQAINLLAETVHNLAETNPEYQRKSGVYVEEHDDTLLLIRSKKWQLVIQVPAKSTIGGKKFELKNASGQALWSAKDDVNASFAELLSMAPRDTRDVLLDICCQYLRGVRMRVNKQAWADANQDIAYLVKGKTQPDVVEASPLPDDLPEADDGYEDDDEYDGDDELSFPAAVDDSP